MCTQLPVLIPKFPIGLGQTLETLALTPRYDERHGSHYEGRAGQQPMESRQPSYVIERVATVSTA